VCALVWGWLVERQLLDRWDLAGAAVCLLGTAICVRIALTHWDAVEGGRFRESPIGITGADQTRAATLNVTFV
jgi:Uncharacterised BCR, YnfA/UPF0060 family